MMEPRPHHWILTLGMAAAAHAGLALLFFESYQSKPGAQAPGLGGIEVSLGSAGASPITTGTIIEPDIAAVEAVAPIEPAVETPAAEMPNIIEPLPEVVAVEEVESVRSEDVVPAEPEPIVPPTAKVQTPNDTVRAQEVKPTPAAPKPQPQSKSPPTKSKPTPPAQPQQQANAARTAPAPAAPSGSAGNADAYRQKGDGSGDGTPGGGMPGATADYFTHLRAWLERHKRYPRPAQLRRQQGTVLLRFVIDRTGQVLSYAIERSSGHRLLDNEVKEMIERASPLPAMPDEMQQARLELVVPVSFSLR